MSTKASIQLVNSLVISRFTYGLCLWGNTTPNHQHRAQIVLNSAARMITGLAKTTRQLDLMDACGWLTMEEMTKLAGGGNISQLKSDDVTSQT